MPEPPHPGQVASARVHQLAHPPHRLGQAHRQRLTDEEMANVELDDLGNGSDRAHIGEAQPMARMALEAHLRGVAGGAAQAVELGRPRLRRGVAIGAGVQLDHRCPRGPGGIELARLGVDEQ